MGKRQIGEMEPSEFVIALLIADLAAVPMQDTATPLLAGVIPIFTVLSIELILSVITYYCIPFRRLLCGKPVILIEDGQIVQANMKKTRLTTSELIEHLREQSIVDLSTVKYAILETNGQISALLYPEYQPITIKDVKIEASQDLELPITLICEGSMLGQNLKIAKKSREWLEHVLQQHHCSISQVYLFTLTQSGTILLIKKEHLK
jgi:uncharacterized membrane protein YcaP (DUF421 family)